MPPALPSQPNLARAVADWEIFAQEDPLWAILPEPAKKGRLWNADEFLATGEADAAHLMQAIERQSEPVAREHLLDFGTGVGRVALPLAQRFQRVTGLDAAPTMIAQATQNNKTPDRVSFVHSADAKLPFPDASFDVVHSLMVLQYLPLDAALFYVSEFVRVLRPRGLAYFVVPACFARSIGPERRETAVTFGARKAALAMQTIPVSEVTGGLERAGASIVTVEIERQGDVMHATYIARRS